MPPKRTRKGTSKTSVGSNTSSSLLQRQAPGCAPVSVEGSNTPAPQPHDRAPGPAPVSSVGSNSPSPLLLRGAPGRAPVSSVGSNSPSPFPHGPARGGAPVSSVGSNRRPPSTVPAQQALGNFLWMWGSNLDGQCGLGNEVEDQLEPARVDISTQVMDVATGGMHTLVLLADGSVWSAGLNDNGALGRTTAVDESGDPIPDRDAKHFDRVALPPHASDAVQVVCSDCASFVLVADGSVYGWGTFTNDSGPFGFSPQAECQTSPTRVYAPSRANSPVVQLAAGSRHVVGVLKDGGAISWGDGAHGQLGRISLRHSSREEVRKRTMLTPTKIRGCRSLKFVEAFCGEYATFLRAENGDVFAFGMNGSGQLAIAPQEDIRIEDTLTLEGRVSNRMTVLTPTLVDSLTAAGVATVAVGRDHALGLDGAGRLYSWGAPTYGVLGRPEMADMVNETTPFPTPVTVAGFEGRSVVDIASGQVVSACIDGEGDLYTWGAAVNDLLGYEEDEDVLVPAKVPRTEGMMGSCMTRVTFGGQHAALLGNRYGWSPQ